MVSSEMREAVERLTRHGSAVMQMVSDYPPGDPADAKMATAILKHCPVGTLLPSVTARPLDTAHLSFRALMLAVSPANCLRENVFFYLNVAPIEHQHERNGAHPFCVALLRSGQIVASPLAGFSFSAFKPWIKELYILQCDQRGRQFRSWQSFPAPLGRFLNGDFDVVDSEEQCTARAIPDLPEQFVWDDDSFCNLRTHTTREDMEARGFHWGDECVLLRDGIPVAKLLFGDPKPGREHRYDRRWLSLKPGSNIIEPIEGEKPLTYLDVFRVYGKASRLAVYDINRYDISLFGAVSEAFAVATRARRTSGVKGACLGFYRVLKLRLSEWWSDIADYERKRPVYSIVKAN